MHGEYMHGSETIESYWRKLVPEEDQERENKGFMFVWYVILDENDNIIDPTNEIENHVVKVPSPQESSGGECHYSSFGESKEERETLLSQALEVSDEKPQECVLVLIEPCRKTEDSPVDGGRRCILLHETKTVLSIRNIAKELSISENPLCLYGDTSGKFLDEKTNKITGAYFTRKYDASSMSSIPKVGCHQGIPVLYFWYDHAVRVSL